jgi:disulfide bond formation protein DsbB
MLSLRIMTHTRTLLLLLLASIAALASAFVAEYGFGLKPCPLCIYQRIPYAVVIAIAFPAFIAGSVALKKRPRDKHGERIFYYSVLLSTLALLTDAAIAFYHVGVEQHWFAGLQTCSGNTFHGDADAVLAQMLETDAVRCDVPAFVFLGLSMAGWNMLYAFALGLLGIAGLVRKYEQ